MGIVSAREVAHVMNLRKFGFLGDSIGWLILKTTKLSRINREYDKRKNLNGIDFIDSILNEFEKLYFHHWNDIILLWQKYCIHENDEVSFHSNNKFHKGTFHGITESGHAQIQINGKTKTFPAGMITL